MRLCGVCKHPQRAKIEDALLRNESWAKIAERVGDISKWAIGRHHQHMEQSIVVQRDDADVPLLDRIENLVTRLEGIAVAATKAKQWNSSIAALREVRACLEVVARLSGQWPAANQAIRVGVAVNVNTGHPAHDLTDVALEMRIAEEVAEATRNFDPVVVAHFKQLVGIV